MIEARHLTKRFGRRTAIDGVSLRVARGEVVGFLGPNGAGKTTTLRVLAGVFPPTSGQALIDGHDLARRSARGPATARLRARASRAARRDDRARRARLRGGAARRAGRGTRRPPSTGALARTGLGGLADRRIGVLSRGTRQRVGLAVALVGDPPALLLDEPTAGMDPTQGAEMRRLIRSLGAGHAVFVSSHALADVETLCDRVIVLHRGRVLAEGAPAELADAPASRGARGRRRRSAGRGAGGAARARSRASGASSACRRATGHARCRVEAERGADLRAALAARVTAAGWPLYALTPVEASLEDAFLALVSAPGTRA